MESITLKPIKTVSGNITLPGSKSLSNRALLLSALARGNTTLNNLLDSDDTRRMITALRQLGVKIELSDDLKQAIVEGNAGIFDEPANNRFFLGNAGTAIRPLTAILGLMPGRYHVDGDQYMHERPIGHLTDALQHLGAEIEFENRPGFPPFTISGNQLSGGSVKIPGDISSQFLTSLLMSLPLAEKDSQIDVIGEQVSKPYLDITLGIMSQYGVTASHHNYQQFHIKGGQHYQSPTDYLIEGDASSASYFFGAAAIAGDIRVFGLGKNSVQGDLAFLDTIEQMGATVDRQEQWIDVHKGKLVGIDVDLNHIPDAAMTIATMALFAEGPTKIRNIYNWRVKETDRLYAMETELRKLGATVTSTNDSILIAPPKQMISAAIDTYGDHRVAMAFSLAALGTVPIQINDPDCTRKTFPDYFEAFASIANK